MTGVHTGALPWLAFAFCCLVWGSTCLFIRIGNDTLPPVWGATLRLAIASVILTAIALAVRAPWPRGVPFTAALWFFGLAPLRRGTLAGVLLKRSPGAHPRERTPSPMARV